MKIVNPNPMLLRAGRQRHANSIVRGHGRPQSKTLSLIIKREGTNVRPE